MKTEVSGGISWGLVHEDGVCAPAWGVQNVQAVWGQVGLVDISPLTFTFRVFRVKVDSKVMGHL